MSLRGLRAGGLAGVLVAGICALVTARVAAKSDTWTEVKSPHFMVSTNGSEKDGRRVAIQFEQVRAVFLKFMGEKLRADASEPIRILAVKDENTFRSLLPEFYETKGHLHPTGVFQAGQERNYVALRLGAAGDSGYAVLYHEYTHFLMRLNYGQLPLWLSEGVAEFYGHMQIGNEEVLVGMPSLGHIQLLQSSRWLPMDALFAVGHDSPYYNETNKASIFYAQSWGLVHYLMLESKRAAAVNDYIHQIVLRHEDPVVAAHSAFGDPNTLTKALETCVRKGEFYQFTMKSPAPLDDTAFPSRELSPAESLAAQGDFLAYSRRPKEARPLLEQAVNLDPKLATPHESLGLLALNGGDLAGARLEFSRAVDLDSRNALAYFYSAQTSLGPGADYDALERAEEQLRKATEINPEFAPAHAQLARVLQAEGDDLEGALQHFLRAAYLEPGESAYLLDAGAVLLHMERFDEAKKTGERAMAQAQNDEQRQAAQRLLDSTARAAQWQTHAEKPAEETKRTAPQDRDRASSRPETMPRKEPELRFRGRVTESDCDHATLYLTLEGEKESLRLRALDYSKINYLTYKGEPPPNFTPCRDLAGRTIRVTYQKLAGDPTRGEVSTIEVLE